MGGGVAMQVPLVKSIIAASLDAIVCADEKGNITLWNPAAKAMFGYTEAEALGQPLTMLLREQDRSAHLAGVRRFLKSGEGPLIDKVTETFGLRRDGGAFEKEMSLVAERIEGKWVFTAIMRDISGRKQAEVALQQRLKGAEATRHATLYMLEDMNEVSANIERIKQEWEATFDAVTDPIFLHDADGNILRANMAYAGKAGMPVEKVIGRAYWRVFPKSGQRLHFREEAEHGGEALEEISTGGLVFLAHSFTMGAAGGEGACFIHWLEDITGRKKADDALKAALEGAIQAVAAAVEARDPYTAGHQRHVAELSVAIATKMGLDAECIEGIHWGAMIHDIGKIHLPAEVLSKPSRLTDIEYRLIQDHPQVGYDILNGIEFPWPVAEIAHQHHERLDGSGYPRGLNDGQICLEARVVAVADVTEAMASHRPYRSGLGIDKALAEIKRGRGKQYDADVADACRQLFKEGKFSFA